MTHARDEILSRLRRALSDSPAVPQALPLPTPTQPPDALALLCERLLDYRAQVVTTTWHLLPDMLTELVTGVADDIAVPADLPSRWTAAWQARAVVDRGHLSNAVLDQVGAVVTGCALAVAETGTIILDAGPRQGRRVLTLLPDRHICVVDARQVVADVPDTFARLDHSRPLTWISGPSATSDIELRRVEGVHGPRLLQVVLVS
ncbi:hypothetical protein ACWT_4033 [Actinoplanes sp. SE50]|uniref:LutC/YkgG family protein n=1 Tax=unclassified Actinoplanes TaxID=2626549 RepID=UPI00023EBBB4|nr:MULTISPECIES: LUD domain-containing protein [unclassified Actinoplanes]AEV85057.1 hypothetical protein ACPL_4162 [Actinoplanes sp. SE50/110]ATO83448.1 hypothetical protein ACWT_4033 [Actinoplanes sp. SE50]SLM00855.1 hypothetical protein ACSP50_4088 [Actinoplanes sp. SE50/110]